MLIRTLQQHLLIQTSRDDRGHWSRVRRADAIERGVQIGATGKPFNIAGYALTMMVAQVVGLEPGDFVHTLADAHLYFNHLEQAREQLTRMPGTLPTMVLNLDVADLFASSIRAPIAI